MWGREGITLPPRTLSPGNDGLPASLQAKAVDEAGRLSSVSHCPSSQLEHQLQLFFSAPTLFLGSCPPPTHLLSSLSLSSPFPSWRPKFLVLTSCTTSGTSREPYESLHFLICKWENSPASPRVQWELELLVPITILEQSLRPGARWRMQEQNPPKFWLSASFCLFFIRNPQAFLLFSFSVTFLVSFCLSPLSFSVSKLPRTAV